MRILGLLSCVLVAAAFWALSGNESPSVGTPRRQEGAPAGTSQAHDGRKVVTLPHVVPETLDEADTPRRLMIFTGPEGVRHAALLLKEARTVAERADVYQGLTFAGADGVDLLLLGLRDRSPMVVRAAARALGAAGRDCGRVQAPLERVLEEHVDAVVRRSAAVALVRLNRVSRPVTEFLGSGLTGDTDSETLSLIAYAGEACRDLAPRLVLLLEWFPDTTRCQAAWTLGRIAPAHRQQAVAILIRHLDSQSAIVRTLAVRRLGQFESTARAAVAALFLRCSDEDAYARALSAFALARVAPSNLKSVRSVLDRLRKDPDLQVRQHAVVASGLYGERKDLGDALSAVVLAVGPEATLGAAARYVLAKIGWPRAQVPDLLDGLRSPNDEAVVFSVRTLVLLGRVESIASETRFRSARVRSAAAELGFR